MLGIPKQNEKKQLFRATLYIIRIRSIVYIVHGNFMQKSTKNCGNLINSVEILYRGANIWVLQEKWKEKNSSLEELQVLGFMFGFRKCNRSFFRLLKLYFKGRRECTKLYKYISCFNMEEIVKIFIPTICYG